MGKYYITILLAVLVAFTSCKSKRLVNKASKFDNAGLYADAASLYYKSLVANANNIDAKLGLQRTGQLVYEDKLKTFTEQYNNGNTKDAVYAYLGAEKYFNMLAGVGVNVIGQDEQKSYFLEVKDQYLGNIYAKARKAIELEEFSTAENLFKEILSIDANYKDAKSQWITAKYEPIYRKGNMLFDTQLYRSAYLNFEIINKGTTGYKNSIELQQASLAKAIVTIAALPMQVRSSAYKTSANQCLQTIIGDIHEIKSPFYKLIDTKAIQTIRGWEQVKDADMAIQLARRWGHDFEAKSIFQSQLVNLTKNQGLLSKIEKRGYLKHTIEVVNPQTKLKESKIVYDKVRYQEYKQKNTLILEINYSLVRVDKDELGLTNTFHTSASDEIHYARFEGDYKNLVPGYWKSLTKDSPEDKIYDNNTSVVQLHELFKNKSQLKPIYTMEKEAFQACARKVTKDISQYQPEN